MQSPVTRVTQWTVSHVPEKSFLCSFERIHFTNYFRNSFLYEPWAFPVFYIPTFCNITNNIVISFINEVNEYVNKYSKVQNCKYLTLRVTQFTCSVMTNPLEQTAHQRTFRRRGIILVSILSHGKAPHCRVQTLKVQHFTVQCKLILITVAVAEKIQPLKIAMPIYGFRSALLSVFTARLRSSSFQPQKCFFFWVN